MSKDSLTRKYRPQKLDELFDQEHIKKILKNAILKNRIHHAYLFTGPRGVGKTSTARILAKSLNCEQGPTVEPCGKCKHCIEIANSNSIDVVEIDGASNRGINEIKNIKENAMYLPVSARNKIFIIDEVHMLTTEAFNALLKILEEPPAHVIFIFATTAPHKVPKTILSRCQRYDFRLISKEELINRLKWICTNENIEIDEKSLDLIAIRAEGSFRDAESILEQIYAYSGNKIVYEDVRMLLGVIHGETFINFFNYLRKGDTSSLIKLIGNVYEEGHDMVEFYHSLVEFTRDIIMRLEGVEKKYIVSPTEFLDQASVFPLQTFLKIFSKMLEKEFMIKTTKYPRYVLEVLTYELNAITEKEENVNIVVHKKEKETEKEIQTETNDIRKIIKEFGDKHFIVKNILEQSEITLNDKLLEIKIPENLYKSFIQLPEEREFEIMLREKLDKKIKIKLTPFIEKKTDAVALLKKHFELEENDKNNRKYNK